MRTSALLLLLLAAATVLRAESPPVLRSEFILVSISGGGFGDWLFGVFAGLALRSVTLILLLRPGRFAAEAAPAA